MKIFLLIALFSVGIASSESIKYKNFLKELQLRNPQNEGVLPHHVYVSYKKTSVNFGNPAHKHSNPQHLN